MYSVSYGNGSAIWRPDFMGGFAKHSWLVAKWVLSIVVIVGFALLPFSTATVGAMLVCIVALFALSVFKPGMKKSKKAKAKNLD